jgi:hypothetical protein
MRAITLCFWRRLSFALARLAWFLCVRAPLVGGLRVWLSIAGVWWGLDGRGPMVGALVGELA